MCWPLWFAYKCTWRIMNTCFPVYFVMPSSVHWIPMCSSSIVRGRFEYTLLFKKNHETDHVGARSGDLGGHNPFEICCPWNTEWSNPTMRGKCGFSKVCFWTLCINVTSIISLAYRADFELVKLPRLQGRLIITGWAQSEQLRPVRAAFVPPICSAEFIEVNINCNTVIQGVPIKMQT
jgi:hypothetical protein